MRRLRLDEYGTPLFETTFVALDLETTGGSPESDAITEIGAIRSRGGAVTGTFHTLVRPHRPIPASVRLLTGIDDGMVAQAPDLEAVLPSLWEFLRGAVLVAHNASFDAGFLAAAFSRNGYPIPFARSVCALRLARRLLRGETHDLRLEGLAASLGATRPCHRAFPDARAAWEVFHRLLELAGPLGILTCEDLLAFVRVGRRPDAAKVALAARVPRSSGVYLFRDAAGRVLYVGKARNLRARVRSYFYGDERPRLAGLVRDAAAVEVERLPTTLAAEVREIELIRALQPRYNQRGRGRPAPAWLRISPGPLPRLVAARSPRRGRPLLGPLPSRRAAAAVLEALQAVLPLARCSDPRRPPAGCAFGEMGQCLAPCLPGRQEAHRALVRDLEDVTAGGGASLVAALEDRMASLAATLRYEEAAAARDRTGVLARALERARIARILREAGDLVVCLPGREGFEVAAIRNGGLVASWRSDSAPAVDAAATFGPPAAAGDPELTPEALAEMLAVWRFIGRAAAAGGWVLWCSGTFASRVADGPAVRWAGGGQRPAPGRSGEDPE